MSGLGASAKVLAELLRPVEAETPYGGQITSYESLGVVWLALGRTTRRERNEDDHVRSVETLTVGVRVDPRLAEGLVLRFGGGDWSIVGVESDPGRPGRATLTMERGR